MAFGKQESEAVSVSEETGGALTDGGEGSGTALSRQATEAVERFRSVIDQASQALRDLSQATGQWAPTADRAREVAQGLRSQGEQAVGTMSKQVEQNPMISVAIAFALGYLLASMTRR
jgi:ElaB/YqjD/DUF883 family membrane-anchored ribosome-binding protein